MDHTVRCGPGEYSEAAVLRCNQRHGVLLILDKLCRRQMSCAAQMSGVDIRITNSLERFRQQNLSDPARAVIRQDLGSESEWFKMIGDDRGSIHCSQSSYTVRCGL